MAYPFPSSTAGPTGKEAMELWEPPEGPSRRRNEAEGAGGGQSGATRVRRRCGRSGPRERAEVERARRGDADGRAEAGRRRRPAGGGGADNRDRAGRSGAGAAGAAKSTARTTRHRQLLATGRVRADAALTGGRRGWLRAGAALAGGRRVCRHRRSPAVNHRQTMSVPLTSTNGSLSGLLPMDEQDNESGPVSGCC
ncbi:hypothetical protein ZWY2020_023654 [Hordeum vulgare]|nr:hypothetical protein ZWY2020_023654 [Hordeum vulgare]